MSYRLDPAKPFAEEVRKLGNALLADAIAILSDTTGDRHEAIHEARKKFKRLRGLYRLIRPLAPGFFKTENARLRDVARSLSGARDAAALVENINYLHQHARSAAEAEALDMARTALTQRRDRIYSEEGDLSGVINAAIAECEKALIAVQGLSLPDSRRSVAKGIARAWLTNGKKAALAQQECRKGEKAEAFHDLRKCCQTYRMYLALLRKIWPSAMLAKEKNASALAELLGHQNDLSVLAACADREPDIFGNGDTLARLLDAIINQQQKLEQTSLERSELVFRDRPDAESKTIKSLWKRACAA